MKIVNEKILFSKDLVYKCNVSLNMSHGIVGVLNCSFRAYS